MEAAGPNGRPGSSAERWEVPDRSLARRLLHLVTKDRLLRPDSGTGHRLGPAERGRQGAGGERTDRARAPARPTRLSDGGGPFLELSSFDQ